MSNFRFLILFFFGLVFSTFSDAQSDDTNLEEIKKNIPKMLNGFAVVELYHKTYVIGDFNGDSFQDLAVVVTTSDILPNILKRLEKHANHDEIKAETKYESKAFAKALCSVPAEITIQNIAMKNGFLVGGKKRTCNQIKRLVQPNPDLYDSDTNSALFIVFGDKNGWWSENNKGRKFLLLGAYYEVYHEGPYYEDVSLYRRLLLVSKKKSRKEDSIAECIPRRAKGDAIYSGEEAAGIVIAFDGNKFIYRHCGC
jgi:hypothetical protein